MNDAFTPVLARPRLTQFIWRAREPFVPSKLHVVGVLQGEGVGPEVVPAALRQMAILREHSSRRFEIHEDGEIGLPAKASSGQSLSPAVTEFVSDVYRMNGALFCGPGGERFVYDLRRTFDLFCEFTPLEPLPELRDSGVLRPEIVASADIVAVRESLGGVAQGEWATEIDENGFATATDGFKYTEDSVLRILSVALELAASRRKRLHVVLKPGEAPSISMLWRGCTERLAPKYDVEIVEQAMNNAVYQLIADPGQFDVILSPNMFGDVLADCGSLLLASRGLSYSGNFNGEGNAVYQAGHGAARDIGGRHVANPIGQILALGMMLRESFNWGDADSALRRAVRDTLREGFRTRDIAMPGCQILGTGAFTSRIEHNLSLLLRDHKI